MAVPRRLPSATKLCAWSAKEKNQADAAAGELPAQAGPGKQCSACSQAGGLTAPAWWGGVGGGHSTEGHPSSESSAEATASSRGGWRWPATRSQPMQQLQADAWGRKGRCSASDSRTTQHGPALCLPSPLLSLPASCQPCGQSCSGALPRGFAGAGTVKTQTRFPEPGNIRFPKSTAATLQSQHSQEVAWHCDQDQCRPGSCLPAQGTCRAFPGIQQGEKPLSALPSFCLASREQRAADDKGKAVPASRSYTCSHGWESVLPIPERRHPGQAASTLSVQE